jgi:hypothetical protein
MTFAVIELGSGSEKVVGTFWADAEAEAQSIASDLVHVQDKHNMVLRRSEDRELPMKPFE